ncbi:MAG: adenylyltransferase/cytidyltransferase family protein [Candidatus Moranbacteria bacterium]|nr:adenylyltransferase/cytidyltransferase family protein [Candidatus Moranbacteria bacterium]
MLQKKSLYKTGVVFGVFDGLHKGHKYFLTEAAKRCEKLIVAVTAGEAVLQLKGHLPRYGQNERITAIQNFNPKLTVVRGDRVLGKWTVLKKYAPNVVFLGHDQQAIAKELTKLHTPFVFLGSHHPEKHKSSLLNK